MGGTYISLASVAPTHFAMGSLATPDDFHRQVETLADNLLLRQFLEAYPGIAVVLNRNRQIVAINKRGKNELTQPWLTELLGLRMGDVFSCVNVSQGPSGCGTSEMCRFCGLITGIQETVANESPTTKEVMMAVKEGHETLEFQAAFSPLSIDGEVYVACCLRDVSHEHRRRSLEKVFFHDLLNTASGISGLAHLLAETPTSESIGTGDLHEMIATLSDQLLEEIDLQRKLLAAESGDLEVCFEPVSSLDILRPVVTLFGGHEVAEGKRLECREVSSPVVFETEPSLLRRVLINMVKNALEATPKGGRVTFGCRHEEGWIVFWVHNPRGMSDFVKAHLFKRSFSTKAKAGRGIGTYSMKLFTEKYLGGRIGFESDESEGTTFSIYLPLYE
jgi:hypothetical protein